MRNIYLLLFCFLPTLAIFAQEKSERTEIRYYFEFKAGETAYLFGDKVNIRADATTDSEVLETASINTPVTVLAVLPAEMTPFLTLNGITAPWVKIQFGKDLIDGYVWAPLLAQYKIENAFHVDFLFSLTKKENAQLYGKLRAVKNGQILDEIEFKVIGSEEHYTYGQVYGNQGVPKIDNIIEAHFGYEACGYINGNQTLVWRNEKFYYLGKVGSFSESGLSYFNTSFIFPKSGQSQPKKVLIKEENGEFDDIGNGKINTKITVWDWTGRKLVKATNY